MSEIENPVTEVETKPQEQKPTPVITFEEPQAQSTQKTKDKTDELVESAFNSAIVHKVANDEDLQKELLDSAGKVVKTKANVYKEKANAEEKIANFNNKKSACECFGYNEGTTEKWAVNVMNVWHNFMTAIWILLGSFTFAPITFVAKKMKVLFKITWLCVLLSLLLYFTVGAAVVYLIKAKL